MYAKIFAQIFDSSIAEDPELRFTFMDLLILADSDGVVDMTHEAISRRTNRPLELVRKTILVLEAPDTRSRTKGGNGVRLKRLDDHRDWGWLILNYATFRDMATEMQRRERTRLRVKKHRSEIASQDQCNADVTPCNAVSANVTPPYPSASVVPSQSSSGDARGAEPDPQDAHWTPRGNSAKDPTLKSFEQVKAELMTVGIPDLFIKWVYDDWATRQWRDGSGVKVQIVDYVKKRWSRESTEWKAGTHKGNLKTKAVNRAQHKTETLEIT